MEPNWWNVLRPLSIPVAASLAGVALAVGVPSRYRDLRLQSRLGLALTVVAVTASLIPNIGQQLYDLGISDSAIEIVQNASYVCFAFAMFVLWRLLGQSGVRWFLLLLVPIAFGRPFLWTLAYISWSTRGFAP